MPKAIFILLCCITAHTCFAQNEQGTWAGGGDYEPGKGMTTIMKRMGSEKKIVIEIDAKGNVTGTMNVTYDKAKATLDIAVDEQSFALTGWYQSSKNLLLLIITHLKAAKKNEPDQAFSKPDSVYYSVVLEKEKERPVITGIIHALLNRNTSGEWVGSVRGSGMGMNVSDQLTIHLLPLRIKLEKLKLLAAEGPVKKIEQAPVPVITPQATILPERKKEIQRTIVLDTSFITLDMYDNGEIDGDTATLILDGKIIMDSKLLGLKPSSIALNLSTDKPEHLLELFANNLGSIPPNAALIVLTCNRKRYEINLSSNGTANGSVRLIFKKE